MYRSIMASMIMAAVLLAGCGDDESVGGGGFPVPSKCADVGGTWSMAFEVEDGWFGPVESSITKLFQSDTCTVTGTMAVGPAVEGYTTKDSLYFSLGMEGGAPEVRIYCALEIIDEYLMVGEYEGIDEWGPMSIHGPDPDCSGIVELQVSTGLEPTFSWQPRCAVSLLLIEPVDGGGDHWFVGNENENALTTGLTYGVAPGGVYSREALPLVAGTPYEAILYRWLGQDDAYLMVGYVIFTP